MSLTPRSPGPGCGSAAAARPRSPPRGVTSVQRSIARGQRGANAHACVPRQVVDHRTGDRRPAPRPAGASSRGIDRSSPCVYGWRGVPNSRCRCARSTIRPAVEHVDRLAQPGDHAEVVRDHDQRGAGLANQLAQQLEDLRLDRDVQRGGRLVGDQQPRAGRPARSRSAPAAACRRRAGAGRSRAGGAGRECPPGPAARRPPCGPASLPIPRCRRSTSVTCSPIGITGFSEDSGSWNTIDMSRPRRSRICGSDSVSRSSPSMTHAAADLHPAFRAAAA